VAVAAVLAQRREPKAAVLVLATDHVVRNTEGFIGVCRSALKAVSNGYIVTFGIRPTEPATGYGYIRPGAKLNGVDVQTVDAFVEKPDAATAARYIAENYYWNSGNFMFRADVMLDEITRFEPAMAEAARAAVAMMTEDLDFLRLASKPFASAPKKSIDYAVMERTKLAAVVPADMGWSDVGSWDAVWENLDHDGLGNSAVGPAVLIDSKNSLVRAEDGMLTAVIGLDNAVVISMNDAVLVTTREKSGRVKDLVEKLLQQNQREAVEHRRIYRPWGHYQSVDTGTRYQVKRIVVKSGGRLSLQKHFHRAEHWVVVKGTAKVTIGTEVKTLHENESIYVPIGSVHRLANPGKIPLELIEVQVGSYLGEDDIERMEDIYGRS
jgi:mannose-1-phosphate guanylyltransferase / mannose-6-phosphate isomerase